MITSPKAVRFDADTLWVSLSDGRTIAAPLAWFPRLMEAAPEQLAQVELPILQWAVQQRFDTAALFLAHERFQRDHQ